mgnify:CR=1 FL=1
MIEIEVRKGSIIEVPADAVVNAANSLGYMGGGVAGFLKRVCGDEVEKEAIEKAPIPVGKAITTSAGKLKDKFKGIIHAPTMERPAMRIDVQNVIKATQGALEEADKMGFKVIAIPGMGTGVGGVSKKDAARAMVKTIKNFKPKNLAKVILVDIDDEMVEEFRKALEEKDL